MQLAVSNDTGPSMSRLLLNGSCHRLIEKPDAHASQNASQSYVTDKIWTIFFMIYTSSADILYLKYKEVVCFLVTVLSDSSVEDVGFLVWMYYHSQQK